MDVFSKSKRSDIMSKVSSKDTKFEILVRKYLFSKGYRFRKNVTDMLGKPDIVLSKYKTIIFVHGCFWHGHKNCEAARLPASNIEYWNQKISSNINRDSQNKLSLEKSGWNVIVVWECELKSKYFEETMNCLIQKLDCNKAKK